MKRRVDNPLRMAVQCGAHVRRPRCVVAGVSGTMAFRLELRIVAGPLRGKLLTFAEDGRIVFGRDCEGEPGELPEADPCASRRHFQLEIEVPRAWVRDLGSTHGTFVNNRDCRPADGDQSGSPRVELQDGDFIEAGETRFAVTLQRQGVCSPVGQRAGGLILKNRVGPPQIEGVEICRRLGRNAWGSAFLGHRRSPDRLCVIKVVRADQDLGPDLPELLDQACATLRAVRHENLVRVRDHGVTRFGAAGWGLCLEMEYCEGGNASAVAAEQGGRLLAHEGHAVLGDALAGLACLHARGMVHGNLKPSNLLFASADGRRRAKLADFALLPTLQRVLATDSPAAGEVADGRAFVAPEQVGNPECLSQAADVWSLGAVFHLLLTGHPPEIAGERSHLSAGLQRRGSDSIRKHYRVVPQGLEGLLDLIDRALATSPDHRFPNALAMQEQFQRLPPPPAIRVEYL